jgi:hypothetical protein
MSLYSGLVAIKSANSTLNALVASRFYPDVAPQEAELPYIVFQEISRTRDKTWGVPLPALSHTTVMMKCYAATSIARGALVSAVLNAFCSTTQQTIGGATIPGIEIDNEIGGGTEMLDTEIEARLSILYFKVHMVG